MNPTVLPDCVLTKMSPEARKGLGKAGKTAAECAASYEAKSEKELQRQIAAMLNLRDIFFTGARFGKKTTVAVGDFDFNITLKGGRHVGCEVKIGKGKLSDGQIKRHAEYERKTGNKTWVVYSLVEFKTKLYWAEKGIFDTTYNPQPIETVPNL